MAIVFMVGLFILCLMKKVDVDGNGPGGVRLKKAPSKGNQASIISATDVQSLLSGMKDGDQMCIVLHMESCGYCKKLINEVVMPMSKDGSLPIPMYLLEVNQEVAAAAQNVPELQSFIEEASGVPATMVLKKSGGNVEYAPMVGYMDKTKLQSSIDAAASNMKPLWKMSHVSAITSTYWP